MKALRTAVIAAGAALVMLVGACEKDPHDPATWIGKLDEASEQDEAVRNLERLKDTVAIKPLGSLWQKMNRPSKVLRAMISIASFDDAAKHRTPDYKDVVPFLVEAVENFDPGDERSIDDATVACDALGRAAEPSVVQTLIAAAQKPMPKLSPGNRVRIAAVRALGHYKDGRAVGVLIKILQADTEQQRLQLHAAAALALAETGDPQALSALKAALFIGPIFQQVRTGLTRIGKQAAPAMLTMFNEKDPEVQALAREKNFAKIAPGNVVYMGAMLLGDLRVKEAVPKLLDGLKAESKPSYYNPKTNEPGPPTHMAILDALLKIGDPSAASAVWEYATAEKTDDSIRAKAVDVYSWLGRGDAALDQLEKWIKDDGAEEQLRAVSVIAYGRLAKTAGQAKVLDELIRSYDAKIAAADAKAKAGKSQAEKDSAEDQKVKAQQWRDLAQESRYRVDIVIQCKGAASCYGAALTGRDVTTGKPGLPKAERALVELYRMGDKGAGALDAVLKAADSTERIVRDGIGLALPRIAPRPCDACATRLLDVVEKQASQTTLDSMNAETRVVGHYFLSAGK